MKGGPARPAVRIYFSCHSFCIYFYLVILLFGGLGIEEKGGFTITAGHHMVS